MTPEDVRRVARQYIGPNRVELDIVPGEPSPASAAADRPREAASNPPAAPPPASEIKDDFDRSKMPPLGPTPRYQPPRFDRRRLSNGLELRVIERHELPIVTVDLVVKSGETLTPRGKEGLASLAANLLEEGTSSRTTMQLAGELAEIGSTIDAAGGLESTTVSLTTLSRTSTAASTCSPTSCGIPSFPEKELERLKLQRLSHLRSIADDPEETSQNVFPRLIYGPDYPYGRPDLGTPASVKSIARDDVIAFYRRIMVPGNAALVVVGDVQPDAIAAALGGPPAELVARPGAAGPDARADPGSAGRAAGVPHRQVQRTAVGARPSGGSAPPASRRISTP